MLYKTFETIYKKCVRDKKFACRQFIWFSLFFVYFEDGYLKRWQILVLFQLHSICIRNSNKDKFYVWHKTAIWFYFRELAENWASRIGGHLFCFTIQMLGNNLWWFSFLVSVFAYFCYNNLQQLFSSICFMSRTGRNDSLE